MNVDGVEPLTGAAQMALKMRDDVVTDGGYPDKVLANAPERAGDFFVRSQGRGVMAASKPAMSLTDLTIAEARDGLRARDYSARELTEAHLAAIEALNPRLNAFVTVTGERALAQADAADAAICARGVRAADRHSAGDQGPVLH